MNLPDGTEIERLHRKYAPNDHVFELVYTHCRIVTEIALWCAGNVKDTPVDTELLRVAAMLHDIAKYSFVDGNGEKVNSEYRKQHAQLGAALLQDEGYGSRLTDIIKNHVGVGLSRQQILEHPEWHLPDHDYLPTSIEGELVCYADCFHSKTPVFHRFESLQETIKNWQDDMSDVEKFEAWSRRFSIPDINALAAKYNHPTQ